MMKKIIAYIFVAIMIAGFVFAVSGGGGGASGPIPEYPVGEPGVPGIFEAYPYGVKGIYEGVGGGGALPGAPYGILGLGLEISGLDYPIGVFGEAIDGIGVYGTGEIWGLYTPSNAYISPNLVVAGDMMVEKTEVPIYYVTITNPIGAGYPLCNDQGTIDYYCIQEGYDGGELGSLGSFPQCATRYIGYWTIGPSPGPVVDEVDCYGTGGNVLVEGNIQTNGDSYTLGSSIIGGNLQVDGIIKSSGDVVIRLG